MILLDIKKFKNIDFTTCINHTIVTEVDAYIKRVAGQVIDTAKKKYKFGKMTEKEQVEHFLKYSLMEIVPSKTWIEFEESVSSDNYDSLYIVLKRHYFLKTNTFPS